MHIKRASLVLGIEAVVLALECNRVHPPTGNGEFAPSVIRIDRQQGVVQVKEGNAGHQWLSIMDLIRGMVMARWVCRA